MPDEIDITALRELTAEHLRVGSQWLQHQGHDDLYILNRCLAPQQALLHQLLQRNGPLWDLTQFANTLDGGAQSWRIVELAKSAEPGGLVHTFHRKTYEQLTDSSIWENMCSHTHRSASDNLRYSLRAAATALELLAALLSSFPLRMFLLLDPERAQEEAAEILEFRTEAPCLLDSFSATHLAKYNTVPMLLSEESLLVLSSVAAVFMGNTYGTETLHSKNFRRSRRHHTQAMSLSMLSMWRQVQAAPQWLLSSKDGSDSEACCSRSFCQLHLLGFLCELLSGNMLCRCALEWKACVLALSLCGHWTATQRRYNMLFSQV